MKKNQNSDLIESACQAQDIFELDELESYAEKVKRGTITEPNYTYDGAGIAIVSDCVKNQYINSQGKVDTRIETYYRVSEDKLLWRCRVCSDKGKIDNGFVPIEEPIIHDKNCKI